MLGGVLKHLMKWPTKTIILIFLSLKYQYLKVRIMDYGALK
jgi:hypothetical protein